MNNISKILTIVCIAIVLAITGRLAFSQESISFSWTPNDPPVDGYKLYEVFENGDITQVGDDILDGTVGTTTILADIPADDKCRTYVLTAFYGSEESDYSQTAAWCPPYDKSVPLFYTRPQRPSVPGDLSIGE